MTKLKKLESETINNHIIRIIDNHLNNGVTSFPDISTVLREKYYYSYSNISKAKKDLLIQLHSKYKILNNGI